ncbi:MAG: helix-turn-helix domain-containing protein [Actinomycetota bacterium]|jgi:AcrR family transcriptional regulator
MAQAVQPKRVRLRAEERREMILDAARRVFLESGFAGARTRRIAEEAGITEALLYRFFPSKSEIFRAAVHEPLEKFVEELLATTADIDPDEGDRRDRLRQVNEMLLRFMADSAPFLAVVLLSELSEARRFYQTDLHPTLSRPIYEVVSRITGWRQRDGSLIFAAMFGTHMGLAIDALLLGRDVDAPRVADQLTRLFSDGMPEEVQAAPVSFRRSRKGA